MNDTQSWPMPLDEYERIRELASYDLNYHQLNDEFGDLVRLAAMVAGAKISMVNLIDHYTQWTVAQTGTDLKQVPREQSVCQYTIMGDHPLEIRDLSQDERTRNQSYVQAVDGLRYYFGIPLQNQSGSKLGALCVADSQSCDLSAKQVAQLELIAHEVIRRLEVLRETNRLRADLQEQLEKRRKLSHDIRGPVGGIIGLADLLRVDLDGKESDDVIEMIDLIAQSGRSVLDLADTLLQQNSDQSFKLEELIAMLMDLYMPQATSKGVSLDVSMDESGKDIPILKHQLLQICGNLISNALKFTGAKGRVMVQFGLENGTSGDLLRIRVTDSGVGMSQATIDRVLCTTGGPSVGTQGELGYGLGLPLVKHLVEQMHGRICIQSMPACGCAIDVELPCFQ